MPDQTELFIIARSIHLTTICITITGFIVRGIWMIRQSPLLQARATKILPHVNDTVLLCSALWAGWLSGQYPFANAWLTAKVLGLLAYIVLGAVALTYGKTRSQRLLAFGGALLSFAYVVAVALTKNPLLFTTATG